MNLRRQGRMGTDGHVPPPANANYRPVVRPEILPLTCDDGTVDQVGDARPAEAMGH